MRLRLLLALPLLATPLAAQQRVIAPAASVLFASTPEAAGSDTVPAELVAARIRGGKTGAVVGAVTGTVLALGFWAIGDHASVCEDLGPGECGNEGPSPVILASSALAGAGIGYLLGRSIPRKVPDPRPQLEPRLDPTEDTGTKWYQGAARGAVLGAAVTAFSAFIFHWGPRMELQDDEAALVVAPLGALIGAVVGGSLAQAH